MTRGSGKGFGKLIALSLTREGADVVVHYNRSNVYKHENKAALMLHIWSYNIREGRLRVSALGQQWRGSLTAAQEV